MNANHVFHEAFFTEFREDAARTLETFSLTDILELLKATSGRNIANLLSSMTPSLAAEVLDAMPGEILRIVLHEISPNIAATLVQRLEKDRQDAILDQLSPGLRDDIVMFMEYPQESVGSLMEPEVFSLPEDLTVVEAIDRLRSRKRRDIYDLYVLDRSQKLVGFLSLRDLLFTPPDERLQSVMRRDLSSIHPLENREQIIELFNERNLLTIPVVDLDNHLLGIIRNQAIMKASQEEATAGLQTMVGASADERALSPPMFAVRKRLPWLQINLLTAFLAAFVVGLFEDTIAKFTALAVLLPVVAGQSGNTGAQSLAVIMRGLALRDIRPSQWLKVSFKEMSVAFVNGLAVAGTTCLGVYLWSRSGGLTLVIGLSMVISMVIAGFSGAVIPIILKSLNQDPAQSSSILLTTVTDVMGFLSFLGLATVFSSYLI